MVRPDKKQELEKVGSERVSPSFQTRFSTVIQDPEWDRFLEYHPNGQYQQSSAWAEYKRGEGWHVSRGIIRKSESLVGGFQLLCEFVGVGVIACYADAGNVAVQCLKKRCDLCSAAASIFFSHYCQYWYGGIGAKPLGISVHVMVDHEVADDHDIV